MAGFKHNQYILFFGCDFTFVKDSNNFLNIEEYINNDEVLNKKIELKYSTLNEYFNEVERDLISTDNLKNIVIMKIFCLTLIGQKWFGQDFIQVDLT